MNPMACFSQIALLMLGGVVVRRFANQMTTSADPS
jgi:hypothetical protein